MANPFVKIWGALKKLGNWIIRYTPLEDFAKKYFASVVMAVVKELSASNLSNADKRAAAFSHIKSAAISNGYDLKDSAINWLIETAVLELNGLISKASE